MYTLVLLRHGQTIYNRDKIFCGWEDIDLTDQGKQEAKSAGEIMKKAGYTFDVAFCSVLTRAVDTLNIALDGMGIEHLPIHYTWKLNERHYGLLQGQKHADIAKIASAEQVQKWRRSFDDKPPQLNEDDPRHPCKDQKYCDIDAKDLPCGESLKDTIARVLPYWESEIVPQIKSGKKVLIAASGNSLRALIKSIEGISDEGIVGLEIKNGTPLVFHLDENMKGIEKYYLGANGEKLAV
jgi:2,3-bisphosphoglycerate-dependent phosphoglycerate mutase